MWSGVFLGQGAWKERWELLANEKAQGKVPSVELPPPETDKKMARCLQQEEQEAERAWRGQDAATLAVVREATGPLTRGQVEGLGGPSLVPGLSQPPEALVA